MTKLNTKIKKIDNLPARQVTFSKRRRGLFKKANELSVLCDAKVAVITFSASGNLFEYSSSSMKDILSRYYLHQKLDQHSRAFLDLQRKMNNGMGLSNELIEKDRQLRHMRGEDLEDLTIEDIMQLEKMLEEGLRRVLEIKGRMIRNELDNLQIKGAQLMEENENLRHRLESMVEGKVFLGVQSGNDVTNDNHGDGQSSESQINSKSLPPTEDHGSDTYLRLGLPFST